MKQERSQGVLGRQSRCQRRGQGTLEYIMLLTVILLALVAAMQGAFTKGVTKMVDESSNAVNNAAGKLKTGLVGL